MSIRKRILAFFGEIWRRDLAASGGIALGILTLEAFAYQTWGAVGSPQLLLLLSFPPIIVGLVIYGYRVQTRSTRLQHLLKRAEISDLHEEADAVLAEVEPKVAKRFQGILAKLESQIYELNEEKRRREIREIPGQPILIASGAFQMGIDDGALDEGPCQTVFVKAFLMDPYPITNQEFLDFTQSPENSDWLPDNVRSRYDIPYYLVEWQGLSPPPGKWDHPVVWVGWFASAAFCNWRSRRQGLDEVYKFTTPTEVEADLSRNGWRLPTEAEWEKAARAGSAERALPFKDGRSAPSRANYGGYYRGTTPVGLFPPNAYGIFDMLGNVKEWCHNWYAESLAVNAASTRDPISPNASERKTFRGGGWMDKPEWITPWRRGKLPPINTNPDCGFRCIRQP